MRRWAKPPAPSTDRLILVLALAFLLLDQLKLSSQDAEKPRERQRQNQPRTFILKKTPLVTQFDQDKNGLLSSAERQKARAHIRETRSKRGRLNSPRRLSSPGVSTPFPEGLVNAKNAPAPRGGLYDENVLRTIHLRLPQEDWYEELGDFYLTDVDLSADLAIDGALYPGVGIRFRGKSSYFTIGKSEKRSFNISIDFTHRKQRLQGYRTLNLLNCHADPTFLREVLYSKICRDYMPGARASFVKLVINGENWGVYVNLQQFNSDFLRDWFGTSKGVRWKVPGRRPDAAFNWNGPASEKYSEVYELKGSSIERPWSGLIKVCELLEKTPAVELETRIENLFNIDRALWFLALENIFMDNDSYVAKASDYALYQDGLHNRIHLLQQDGSEPFGVRGPEWGADAKVSPVLHEDNPARPLIYRLLAVPHLRARYLAHYRTITRDWLSRESILPIMDRYLRLISKEVSRDQKKIFSRELFEKNREEDVEVGRLQISGLLSFIDKRRSYLLSHPELDRPAPSIKLLPISSKRTILRVRLSPAPEVERVLLHHCANRAGVFEHLEMLDNGKNGDSQANDLVYSARLPAYKPGTTVRYYVEARALDSAGTSSFEPSRAEARPHHLRLPER